MSDRTCVVITGSSGFLGRNFIDELMRSSDIGILALDQVNNLPVTNRSVQYFRCDLLSSGDISNVLDFLRKSQYKEIYLVHLAAVTHSSCYSEKELREMNVRLLQNTLALASLKEVKKFVFSSSALVYGTKYPECITEDFALAPENAYAQAKRDCEEYILGKSVNFPQSIILRFTNIYGLGMSPSSVIATVEKQLRNNELALREYMSVRDFLYIQDAIAALRLSVFSACSFQIYNVGTAQGHSIYELVKLMAGLTGKQNLFGAIQKPLQHHEKLVVSHDRITHDLRWMPEYSLEQGLQKMVHSAYA